MIAKTRPTGNRRRRKQGPTGPGEVWLREKEAWSTYWAGAGAKGAGCLPKASGAVDTALRQVWTPYFASLGPSARFLDLACGNGSMLLSARKDRADLELFGIDYAPKLPDIGNGITLQTSVQLEELPFSDGRFDGVGSQYGLEYGDLEKSIVEAMRILRAGGRFQFVLHHADSDILAHNSRRREALGWVAIGSGLIERAKQVVASRPPRDRTTPQSFVEAAQDAAKRYSDQSVSREITTAILLILRGGSGETSDALIASLDHLAARVRNELARIDALKRVALSQKNFESVLDGLAAHGADVTTRKPLYASFESAPIAWMANGIKR